MTQRAPASARSGAFFEAASRAPQDEGAAAATVRLPFDRRVSPSHHTAFGFPRQ